MNEAIRINKLLAMRGVCSRREADRLIAEGRVSIEGQPVLTGMKVAADAPIAVDGKRIEDAPRKKIYLALNKPRGIVCTTDPSEKDNIVDFLGLDERIFPIGRLDKDSEGLILLTNDGEIVNRILRARYRHEKEYLVEVDRPFDEDFARRMRAGVPILDTVTAPAKFVRTSERRFRIVLTQGLNRQIRRMCEALGYDVRYLCRLRIMNITLGKLSVGHYRPLGKKELRQLVELLERSEARYGRHEADRPSATEEEA